MSKSDKTEQPTPKRRKDSRKKGQIAKSQELTGWISLLVGLYLLPWMIGRVAATTEITLHELGTVAAQPSGEMAAQVLGESLQRALLAVLPLMAVVGGVATLVSLAQTGLVLSLKPITPDVKRINPLKGLQRLFSKRSLWETTKQVLKVTVVIAISWPGVFDLVELLVGRGRVPLQAGLPPVGEAVLGVVRTIAWTMCFLAFADYGYQRYQTKQDLKMSKQEVKDEHKNTEGDGLVKGRIRSMQRALARNRMIADMSNADVVVTNPTHIAVALQYDPALGRAPKVIAVGAGSLAARIRERAQENSIPLVEAKPLARALWRACEAGDEIPAVLYEAVAKVLAFVHRLDRRFGFTRPMELPPAMRVAEDELQAVPRKRRRL
jgi:flagellar biosynthetic protein FlhB